MLYLYPVDTNLTIYITLPVDSSGISRLGKGKYAILKNWTGDIENSVFTIINCPMRMYVEFKDQNGVQYTTSDQSSLSPYYNELTAIRYTGIGISIDGKGTTSEWMLTGNFNVIVFNPDKSKSKTISGKYNLSASGTHS